MLFKGLLRILWTFHGPRAAAYTLYIFIMALGTGGVNVGLLSEVGYLAPGSPPKKGRG